MKTLLALNDPEHVDQENRVRKSVHIQMSFCVLGTLQKEAYMALTQIFPLRKIVDEKHYICTLFKNM